jgi:hypothetical protein
VNGAELLRRRPHASDLLGLLLRVEQPRQPARHVALLVGEAVLRLKVVRRRCSPVDLLVGRLARQLTPNTLAGTKGEGVAWRIERKGTTKL